jgi:ABC-type lipoprotein export system ATPase subunit
LADEPTGHLDPANKQRILETLLAYTTQRQAVLLMITHDHALLPYFDRVIDLDQLRGAR